jgi:hypothetical protein
MDVDIICKILKINKGGVGGVRKAGNREQEKPGGVVGGHELIVRRGKVILCNGGENRWVCPGCFLIGLAEVRVKVV